jgi:hypothetical protein
MQNKKTRSPRRPAAASRKFKERQERLLALQQQLIGSAREYRSFFSTQQEDTPNAAPNQIIHIAHSDPEERNRAILRQLRKELASDLHYSDTLVEFSQIEQTEDVFRSLCRMLQDLIEAASYDFVQESSDNKFRRHDSDAVADEKQTDLAELALRTLAKLTLDRTLLVESTRNRQTYPQSADSSSHWPSLWGIFGPSKEDDFAAQQPAQQQTTILASDDPAIGVTHQQFAIVMQMIASTAATESNRHALETTARRMVDLLSVLPSSWQQGAETLKLVLQMLCRVGTLQSAQEALGTFQRHPSNPLRVRFSLVLQAYLEAVKHEPIDSNRILAVQEVVSKLNAYWNTNLPRHRVERIVHASIVMHAMCVANRVIERDPEANFDQQFTEANFDHNLVQQATLLVRRTLSSTDFERMIKDIHDLESSPKLDTQIAPLLNGLAQLYATSGDASKLRHAQAMLMYVIQSDDSVGAGRLMEQFPHVDSFNTILRVLVNTHKQKPDAATGAKDLNHSLQLLKAMLLKREQGYWPDDTSFALLFRLLLTVNPHDIGHVAEDLFSKMELRRSYISASSPSSQDDVAAYLSSCHKVLRCWLEAANTHGGGSSSENIPQRALRLVETLEQQSTPWVMSDREVQVSKIPNLYDVAIRPTKQTYNRVLEICQATATTTKNDDSITTANVAAKVYQRLLDKGWATESSRTKVAACCARLPEDSEQRKTIQKMLQQESDLSTGDDATQEEVVAATS